MGAGLGRRPGGVISFDHSAAQCERGTVFIPVLSGVDRVKEGAEAANGWPWHRAWFS